MCSSDLFPSHDRASSQWFLRPHANADIVDEALNVNKVTREELETLPEPHLVFKEFKKCLTEDVNPFKVGKGLKDKFFFVFGCCSFSSTTPPSHLLNLHLLPLKLKQVFNLNFSLLLEKFFC